MEMKITWQPGDVVSIVNGAKHEHCAKIVSVNGDKVTLDSLPFDSIAEVADLNFDDYSIAVYNKPAEGVVDLGKQAAAIGNGNKASNRCATAIGGQNVVQGQYGFAEGQDNTVKGYAGHAEGLGTETIGDFAHSEGYMTKAEGVASHAEGGNRSESNEQLDDVEVRAKTYSIYVENAKDITLQGSLALGVQSHAEGTQALAYGYSSHAEGYHTRAIGDHSHAEGNDTRAYGSRTHAEGFSTRACGNNSHAEGTSTEAGGNASHAEGNGTNAIGDASHAEGRETKAQGANSHAGGRGTIAKMPNQTVIGLYNADEDDALFIVGNGQDDANRSNAFAVKSNGDIVVGGKIKEKALLLAEKIGATTIVCEAEGELVTLKDASDLPLAGLRIFGRTTQDGTPTPDAPVELVSIADNEVVVCDDNESDSFQTLTLPDSLPGIPVTSGGNYTDSDGQQWVCDEIDFGRGVYVQRVNVAKFDNAVGTRREQPGGSGLYRFDFTIGNNPGFLPSHNKKWLLCNALQRNIAPLGNNNVDNAITVYDTGGIYVRCDRFATIEAFLEWAKSIDLTAVYALATPTETALDEETLAAYARLHTHKPNTTIYNDAGAWMQVSYAADTKTYIDNKFNELAAAIVNNT